MLGSTLDLRRFARLGLAVGLVLVWAPAAAASDGDDTHGAAHEEDARTACVLDPATVRAAVTGAYEELQRIHRTALPGPRGRTLTDQRVAALVERSIHIETFVERVLRQIWRRASPEQRQRWRAALAQTLRRRYLRGIDAPTRHELEVLRADVSCPTASVRIRLTDTRSRDERVIDMELIDADGGWRVYDVSIDGASLVRTWRSRFNRIYEDGGLAAVDAELAGLAERYRAEGTDSPR